MISNYYSYANHLCSLPPRVFSLKLDDKALALIAMIYCVGIALILKPFCTICLFSGMAGWSIRRLNPELATNFYLASLLSSLFDYLRYLPYRINRKILQLKRKQVIIGITGILLTLGALLQHPCFGLHFLIKKFFQLRFCPCLINNQEF